MSGGQTVDPVTFKIGEGYRPGLIGGVTTLHAETYSRFAGFGAAFEAKVASEFAAFVGRHDRPVNGLWHIAEGDRIVGSIVIDGEDLSHDRAHLRWFIVDPSLRGAGLGKRLLTLAIDFADRQGFAETHLWTLKGLKAARALYESFGFALVREYEGDQWGRQITEQIFVRKRPGTP